MRDDDRPPNIDPLLDVLRGEREDKRTEWRKAASMREGDSAHVARKFNVNTVSILFGILFGALGAVGSVLIHRSPLFGFVVGFGIVFAFIQFFAHLLPSLMSSAGASVYLPSGSSTPAPPEYSLAQSLAVRGQFAAAIRTYEDSIPQHPDDPEPCIRIARILRDSLQRYDEAVMWFKRARERTGITEAQTLMVSREIAELYMYTLRSPSKALPELARLAEKHPDTPAGDWARTNLREIKENMRADESSS